MNTRKHRGYSEDEVIAALRRKNDVRVRGAVVEILRGDARTAKGDLGNGTKGKIDFLTKHCGYYLTVVDKF